MKIKVRTGLDAPWDECYLQTVHQNLIVQNTGYKIPINWKIYFYPTLNWDKEDGHVRWDTDIPNLKQYILECQCSMKGLNPDFTPKEEIHYGEIRNITKMQKIGRFLKSLFSRKC